MKKYTFRLEQVRRVRRTQEEVARAELLAANSEVQVATRLVEQRMAEYEVALSKLENGTGGIEGFMKQRYFTDLAGKAIVVARGQLFVAQANAELRRVEWSEKAQKVKALDRFDERGREEFQLEFDREEAKELDDLVTGRFARELEAEERAAGILAKAGDA